MVTNNPANRAGGKGSVASVRQPTQIWAKPDEFVHSGRNLGRNSREAATGVYVGRDFGVGAGRFGGPQIITTTGPGENGTHRRSF
jgi:hypothetical protein